MKLFPAKSYAAVLRKDCRTAMVELKQNTDITDSLISDWTKKAFRGQVYEKGFKVISSEIGRGALCGLTGEFEGKKGKIEVRLHGFFKAMFSAFLLFPFAFFGQIAFTEGFSRAVDLLPALILLLLFVGFVFLELSFRFISHTGLKKLTKVLGIVKMIKNEAQQNKQVIGHILVISGFIAIHKLKCA